MEKNRKTQPDSRAMHRVGMVLAALAAQPAMAGNALDISAELGLRWEDNLSLSPDGDDEVDDLTTQLALTGSYEAVRTDSMQVLLGGGVHYDYVDDTSDLSNYGASVSALLRGELDTALTAPWMALGIEGTWLAYDDSDIRDGYLWELGATLGKRLNSQVGISGGYRYFYRRSTDSSPDQPATPAWVGASDVFDLQRDSIFARIDVAAGGSTNLFAEVSYFDGDVAASGRSLNNGTTFDRARDFAFGNDYIVWKIDADGYTTTLGLSHGLTNQFSVNASLEYLTAEGESDNDYSNTAVKATGTYRF